MTRRSCPTAISVELEDGAESYLLWQSTGTDVAGHRLTEIAPDAATAILAAYPRLDFKRGFDGLFVDQARRKPNCPAAQMVAAGFSGRIAAAAFYS